MQRCVTCMMEAVYRYEGSVTSFTGDGLSQFGNYACPNSQLATIAGNNSTNNFIVQFCGGVTITTPSPLPAGEVNVFYNQFIQASDCSGIYNWSQTGGTLPGNMNLSPGGNSYVLSGFPTNSGTFVFTVQVDDGAGGVTNHQFSVSISNRVQVTTTTLPRGTNGASYSQQLQAGGGVPFGGGQPYNWTVSSGSPPANISRMGSKYGYNESDAKAAGERSHSPTCVLGQRAAW